MSETPMLSYAQNGEDVVLWRALRDREQGFYVDVGACHPTEDSVTLHFYQRGWRGVNIEPDGELFAAFAEARPRDTNLCLAVGRERGRMTFYPTAIRGHGTLQPEWASGEALARTAERVPALLLGDIIECFGPDDGEIDFLKIDVEGWEADVIASADWMRQRPRVLLIEAVDRLGRPSHDAWEPTLLAAGYRFALFDGVNRFYCREEDADQLQPRLAAPANVLDGWMRASDARAHEAVAREHEAAARANEAAAREHEAAAREREAAARANEVAVQAKEAAEQAQAAVHAAEVRAQALGAELEQERAARAAAEARLAEIATDERRAVLEVELERARAQATVALRREEAAEERLAVLQMDAVRAAREIDQLRGEATRVVAIMRASTSWRATAPLRGLARLLGRGA